MPSLKAFGTRWSMSSDAIPLVAFLGWVFHVVWIVLIIIGIFICTKPSECHSTPAAAHYLAMVLLFWCFYIIAAAVETGLMVVGFRGAPLEISKRRWINQLLYIQAITWAAHPGVLAYGTWTVATQHPQQGLTSCWHSAGRQTAARVLLGCSWGVFLWDWLHVLIVYNLFPTFDSVDSWMKRFRLLSLGDGKAVIEDLKDSFGQRGMGKVSELYAGILSGVDLSPTDQLVGFMLLASLQRMRRRHYIIRSLVAAAPENQAAAIAEMTDDSSDDEEDNHFVNGPGASQPPPSSFPSDDARDSAPKPSKGADDRAPSNSPDEQVAAKVKPSIGPSSWHWHWHRHQREQSQRPRASARNGHLPNGSAKSPERSLSADSRHVESRGPEVKHGHDHTESEAEESRRREDFTGQASLSGAHLKTHYTRDSFLCPSAMAPNLNDNLQPEELAEIYTGHHQHVPANEVAEAQHFAKYACATYGANGYAWMVKSKWKARYDLGFKRGRRPYNKNELNRHRIKSRAERKDYEAFIMQSGVADEDLLYFNFSDKAVGHVPYLVALDRKTTSVIVAIRGTMSFADLATDAMALPESVWDWLPDSLRQDQAMEKKYWAHGGMLKTAKAIWQDLEDQGILSCLLSNDVESQKEGDKEDQEVGQYVAAILRQGLHRQGWRLVITGHSLGAGAAAIIALKLSGTYPDLKCWAYAPPGGLVSRELSEAMRPFTTSIAVGKDGVPRLSLKNLARMLDELITALARCRKPATSVMLNYRRYKHEKRSNALFLPEDKVPQEALDYLYRYRESTDANNLLKGEALINMYPPGRMIYLRRIKYKQQTRYYFDAVYIEPWEIIDEGVLISKHMSSDHYTDCLMEALQCALGRAQWPGAQEEASTGNAFVGDGKASKNPHKADAHPDVRDDAPMTASPSCPGDEPGPADGQTGTDARRQGASTEHGRGHGSDIDHNFGGNAPRDAGSFHPEQDAGKRSATNASSSSHTDTPGPAHDDRGIGARQQGDPTGHGQQSDSNTRLTPDGSGSGDGQGSQLREGAGSNPEIPQRQPGNNNGPEDT